MESGSLCRAVFVLALASSRFSASTGLECSANGTDLVEGDLVMLTCAHRSSTPVFLVLSISDREISSTLKMKNETITALAYYNVVAGDNGSPFVCTTESLSDRCETAAVDVRHKPVVDLKPPPRDVYYGFDATYTCEVSANPEPVVYQWLVGGVKLPSSDYSKFKVEKEDNSKLVIENAASADVGLTIECNVSNDLGSGAASVVVSLEDIMVIVGPLVVSLVFLIVILIIAAVLYYKRPGTCCQCGKDDYFDDEIDEKYIGRAKTTRERTRAKHLRKYQNNDYDLSYESPAQNGHISASTNVLGPGLGLADSYENAGYSSAHLGIELRDAGIKSVSSIEDNEAVELISVSDGNNEDSNSSVVPRGSNSPKPATATAIATGSVSTSPGVVKKEEDPSPAAPGTSTPIKSVGPEKTEEIDDTDLNRKSNKPDETPTDSSPVYAVVDRSKKKSPPKNVDIKPNN